MAAGNSRRRRLRLDGDLRGLGDVMLDLHRIDRERKRPAEAQTVAACPRQAAVAVAFDK